MIELYAAATPNGRKATIMLEETGLAYRLHRLELAAGDQRRPAFLSLNPNGKIPVIVDPDQDMTITESGAVLVYLAEKAGILLPAAGGPRYEVLQWLFFQVGGVGPMAGQFNHFRGHEPHDEYAFARFRDEVHRLLGVMDGRLSGCAFIAGDYSIADIALVPWTRALRRWGVEMEDCPAVIDWHERIMRRPAVRRGFDVLEA